ncbi:MAG TPA: flagellar biosynthetic protein FliO [Nocardioidaceae bacterium]|nr:flagellar biosynthetic protein FliO [Nocardioidaceae bacterium]
MIALTIRLVVSLAIVVGLLIVLARVGSKRFAGQRGDLVHVVHRQALTRTSSVAVVTVGSRVLVLGTTEQQVQLLTELDPDELELVEEPAVPLEGDPSTDGAPVRPGPTSVGSLSGSVLSPATWRQAVAAVRRAS